MASRGTGHLILRGTTYYFRIAIPRDLRTRVGRRELRYSLGTGYADIARLKAKRLALAAHDLFARLRNGKYSHMINTYEIKEFFDGMFRLLLEQNEFMGIMGSDSYPELMNYVPGFTEKMAAHLRKLLIDRNYAKLDEYVTTFFEDFDLPQPEDETERKFLAHEFAKHMAQYFDIISHRAQGDYSLEQKLYPPLPEVVLPPVVQPVATPAEPEPQPTPSLGVVLAEYRADQLASGAWTERSAYDVMSSIACLPEILGDIPVGSVDFAVMREFKKTLRRLPPNRNKKKEYRDKTLREILQLEPKEAISKRTFNNIMTNVSSFFGWCVRHGYLDKNFAEGLKERSKEREDEARAVFVREELTVLFNAPEYRNDTFKNPSMFWVPLLLAYTGARREEICQLYVEDIRQEDGVWVLDINDNPNKKGEKDKKIKTANAKRLIPIHPKLVELGFLEYWRSVQYNEIGRLFPELKKIKDKYGHSIGTWFGRFRHRIWIDSEQHDLHSFRHTFIDHLKQKFVPEEIYVEVTGHKIKGSAGAKQSTAGRVYAKRFPPSVLLEKVIRQIDYDLDLTHLKGSKFGAKLRDESADCANRKSQPRVADRNRSKG